MNDTPRDPMWRRSQVVITGGSGGLAQAIAGAFTHSGHAVNAPGRELLDVTDPDSVAAYFHGREVDLLICAAGLTRDQPLARMDAATWNEVWSVNLRGARTCAREVIPGMRARGTGHIVMISSHSALRPPAGQVAYAAAKAALLGLTHDLATRHGSAGIRVNALLPGFLETPMTATVSPSRRAEVLSAHALGRLNTCEAVARFLRFLHDELPHTSGQVFQLDSRASGC